MVDISQIPSDQSFLENDLNCFDFNPYSVTIFPSMELNNLFLFAKDPSVWTKSNEARYSLQNSWEFDIWSSKWKSKRETKSIDLPQNILILLLKYWHSDDKGWNTLVFHQSSKSDAWFAYNLNTHI